MATLTISKEDEKRVKALGFLSNKEDERYLTSIDGQKNSAKALADAIIDYVNSLPIN